tara:strand:+ start:644 stop:913 length:270 start_codon:yes stop_codon:yes gene_type:complete
MWRDVYLSCRDTAMFSVDSDLTYFPTEISRFSYEIFMSWPLPLSRTLMRFRAISLPSSVNGRNATGALIAPHSASEPVAMTCIANAWRK